MSTTEIRRLNIKRASRWTEQVIEDTVFTIWYNPDREGVIVVRDDEDYLNEIYESDTQWVKLMDNVVRVPQEDIAGRIDLYWALREFWEEWL